MFTQSSKGSAQDTPKATAAPAPRGAQAGEPSVISADLKVVGDLHSAGDIQVRGVVEGDIKSRSVTIGEGAHVQGSVSGDTVHISGSIKGQVQAPSVTVAKSAKVSGDIVHESLSIEAGAHMEGQIRRLESKPAAQPVAGPKPAETTGEKRAAGGG